MYVYVDFCAPAKVYSVLAFLTLLYYVVTQVPKPWIIFKALLFIVWVFVLNKMCKEGYKPIAWTLSIIPHVIFLICTTKQNAKTE